MDDTAPPRSLISIFLFSSPRLRGRLYGSTQSSIPAAGETETPTPERKSGRPSRLALSRRSWFWIDRAERVHKQHVRRPKLNVHNVALPSWL